MTMTTTTTTTTTTISRPLWNIILAAGDGTRLSTLTRQLHGDDRPKQFATLDGRRSMLANTLARFAGVAPDLRTAVVVAEKHLRWSAPETAHRPALTVIAQPHNRGTGPGVLLPLCHVLACEPEAEVVITPSDHHFERPERFTSKLSYALEAAAAAPSGVCLLAVEAEEPSSELGWIVPGAPLAARPGANAIARFIEKPAPLLARALFDRGALWNTFVMVGRAQAFWELARQHLPLQTALFERHFLADRRRSAADARALAEVYAQMPAADFSRDLLGRAAGLAVTSVGGSGWSDWGTPARVLESLAGTPVFSALQKRLQESAEAA